MAVEGLRLKAYLVKLFGPALAELTGLSKGLDSEISELSVVIEKLTFVLDEDTFIALIKRLFANVVVNWTDKNDGQKKAIAFTPDFDSAMNIVFQGELFSIYPVIAFVLEVNYPDFFQQSLLSLLARK